jgi:hypothetical protein
MSVLRFKLINIILGKSEGKRHFQRIYGRYAPEVQGTGYLHIYGVCTSNKEQPERPQKQLNI